MGEIRDIVIDCLDDDLVVVELEELGEGRLVMDPERDDEPFLDEDGYLTLRFLDPDNVSNLARHLEKKIQGLRVVEIVDPTRPEEIPAAPPGSARAQQEQGLSKETNTF